MTFFQRWAVAALVFASPQLLAQSSYPSLGKIVRNSPQLDALIAPDAKIEVLASGFT